MFITNTENCIRNINGVALKFGENQLTSFEKEAIEQAMTIPYVKNLFDTNVLIADEMALEKNTTDTLTEKQANISEAENILNNNVATVKKYITKCNDLAELSEMIIDEQTNQKRSSVLEALENRIEKLS